MSLLILFALIYTEFIHPPASNYSEIKSKEQNNKETENTNSPTENSNNKENSQSSSSADGSGSDSSDGSNANCIEQQISYSLSKFKTSVECTSSDNPCPEKIVNCSVALKNLDYNIEGEFTIEFILKDKETSEQLDTEFKTLSVQPRTEREFAAAFTTIEYKDKELDCQMRTSSTPKEIIC